MTEKTVALLLHRKHEFNVNTPAEEINNMQFDEEELKDRIKALETFSNEFKDFEFIKMDTYLFDVVLYFKINNAEQHSFEDIFKLSSHLTDDDSNIELTAKIIGE